MPSRGVYALIGLGLLGAYTLGHSGTPQPSTPPATPIALVAQSPAPTRPVVVPSATVGPPVTLATAPQAPITMPAKSERAEKKHTTETVLTSAAVAALIIAASRSAYYATGHPCACPNDRMRNGRACGGRSAYSRPGGASPLCYPKDVTTAMIDEYRSRTVAR
jgi:hypothetical protein